MQAFINEEESRKYKMIAYTLVATAKIRRRKICHVIFSEGHVKYEFYWIDRNENTCGRYLQMQIPNTKF